MNTTSEQQEPDVAPTRERRATLLRIAIPCVIAAGACALVWAGLLSGTAPASWSAVLGGLVAVAGVIVWEIRPRIGRWILVVTGAVGVAWSGILILSGGSLPWLLVGFWGSVAVLLAATLDFVVGPTSDRSATIAVLAVATLLLLSALGLGDYVRITWSPAERSILDRLPVYRAAMAHSIGGAAKRVVAPAAAGEWGLSWSNVTGDPAGEMAGMRNALVAEGWDVSEPSPTRLMAVKNGFTCEIVERAVKSTAAAATSSALYSVQVAVHVGTAGTQAAQ